MNKATELLDILEANERKSLEKEYKTEDGVITSSGKFEGEMIYVPYFWNIYLDGGADDEKGDVLIFKVSSADIKLFPELKGKREVKLKEDGSGFVSEV